MESRVYRIGLLVSALLMAVACLPCSPLQPPAEPTAAPDATVTLAPTHTPPPATTPAGTPVPPTSTPSSKSKLVFASFNEPAVDAEAAIQHEPIAPDLSNVQVPFVLSQAQIDRLAENGFVVSPGTEKEFFTLYEKARYDNVPIFVTSDSLFHVYHLLFDKVLRTAEVEYFIPLLRDLNQTMLARTDALYQEVQGSGWEEEALRTVAFFGVASRLLDPGVQVPQYAAAMVDEQVALIEQADGIAPSPVFPTLMHGEDYTQYIPRGHYTKSEALKTYFKTMMWYGRMTFRLKTRNPDAGRQETRSALLLMHALRTAEVNGRPAVEVWADLYSPTVFFVGRSDDLTVLQYSEVMDVVYGPDVTLEALTDEALLDQFIEEANKLPPPRILGMVISDQEDVEEETKGLRFMGQRFVPDAYIFRQLIYRNVGQAQPPNRRGLPNGLDVPAAMGSERAYQILEQLGETDYDKYPQQMDKVQAWLSGLGAKDWTETLYNSWLYSFFPLLEPPTAGYPAFMQSTAWVDKQLNTVLGSWAELKHDTILYAKQVYAELGGGPPPPPPTPPRGYVEPVPHFYARLAALTDMTREGLNSRGLLNEQDADSLQRLGDLARDLQTIAEKELRGEPLTAEEYEIIRFYGGEIEHLTMAAADTPGDEEPGGQKMLSEKPQAAVIADVATDPDPEGDGSANPVVLEVAVGRIDELHAVVPIVEDDGSITLQVAKGGVFSYYEFPWPAEDRLTDEKWRTMLDEGKAPERPAWIDTFFTPEGEHSALRQGVTRFQDSLVNAFWYLEPDQLPTGGDTLTRLRTAVEQLQAEKRYQARTLMDVNFRSFDRQSGNLAVVTVRETWQDTLHEYTGDWPGYDEPAIGQRGPYTLDVTYTLEPDEAGRWSVTRVVYANEPPAWQ
jgi:hypothetical protein